MPVVHVRDDDVATGTIGLGGDLRTHIEIEHAPVVELHEGKPTTVIDPHIKARGLIERDGLVKVTHGKSRGRLRCTGLGTESAEADPAQLHALVAQQRRHSR